MALLFRKLPQRKSRLTCKDTTRQRIGRNSGSKKGRAGQGPPLRQTVAAKELKNYSCEPKSPLPPSPPEDPGLPPPPPAAAFCCFSRASRIRALRERRTLLPSIERTLTRTW